MSAEIVPAAPTALAAFGTKNDLDALANRFLTFFDVTGKKTGAAADAELEAARPAALKAAQYTIRFGATPGVHVYLVKRGGKWGAEPSLEMWKAMADRHAFLGNFRYVIETEPMAAAEVEAATPPNQKYSPKDRGCRARVLRLDLAREMRDLGLKYNPSWQTGFWREFAYEEQEYNEGARKYVKTGKWTSDTIPNQRTPEQVAERRASRAALIAAFNMIELDDFVGRYQSLERAAEIRIMQAARYMDAEIQERERKQLDATDPRGFLVEKTVQYEEDGDVIWATEPPRRNEVVTVQAHVVGQEAQPQSAPPAATVTTTGNGGAGNGSGNGHKPTAAALKAFHAIGSRLYGQDWDGKRHEIIKAYTKGRTESSRDLTPDELRFLTDRMDAKLQEQLDSISIESADELNPDAAAIPA